MRSGGITVKFEKVSISDEIKFYLEDVVKPVVVIELDGMIYKANEQFKSIFGVEIGTLFEEIVGEQSLDLWRFHVEAIKIKKRMTFDLYVTLKNATQYIVKISMLFCPEEGKLLVLFNLPTELSKVYKHQSLAFQKSDSLIMVANANGYIEDVNDLTNEFFELPRDYFIGLKANEMFKLFSGEIPNKQSFLAEIKERNRAEIILQYIHTSGEVKYYKITSYLDEDHNMYLTRIADYTERAMLKRDVSERGSLSEVGQLAASIAHEIRNPMTTLKGFTQLLKATATEETLKYLTVIDDEISRMESILSEMLYLSKPVVNEKKQVPFNRLVLDIIRVISPKATFEGIKIIQKGDFSSDCFVYGDEGKLKQALLNLLKNGLESMGPGGTLTITLKESKVDELQVVVEDTGKGMYDAQLDQIFSSYFTTRPNGTGLGLPFVLKTVEDHGGVITVSSKIHIGSKFALSFPVCQDEWGTKEDLTASVLAN